MNYNIGYIGNLPFAIESIVFSDFFKLKFVVFEKGRLTDDLLTILNLRSIPYYEISKSEEILKIDEITEIDFFVMCSFGKKISPAVIEKISIYNIHFGELPYYKGRHPTFHATIANELRYGISIHKIDEKIDEGDIISIEKVDYYYNENEKILFEKLQNCIPKLLNSLHLFIKEKKTVVKNIDKGAYYKPVSEKDKIIELNEDFAMIYNKIRAQYNFNGCKYTSKNGRTFFIKEIKLSKFSKEFYTRNELVYKDEILVGLVFTKDLFIKLIKYLEI